jgi:hypothetical protein
MGPRIFAIVKLLETGQAGFFSIALQLAYNNRESSLFAIAKLLETGQVGFFFVVLQLTLVTAKVAVFHRWTLLDQNAEVKFV